MPSGEGNAENSKKTTLGLISKKATLQVQHSFFVHFFPVVCTSTTWNYQKLPSYTFYGGNVVLVSCSLFFFSLPLIFTLVATSISQFLTAAAKFLCCSSNKKSLLSFLSLALAFCRSFSRWASLACHLYSLFLCLSLYLYSKFVDMK